MVPDGHTIRQVVARPISVEPPLYHAEWVSATFLPAFVARDREAWLDSMIPLVSSQSSSPSAAQLFAIWNLPMFILARLHVVVPAHICRCRWTIEPSVGGSLSSDADKLSSYSFFREYRIVSLVSTSISTARSSSGG